MRSHICNLMVVIMTLVVSWIFQIVQINREKRKIYKKFDLFCDLHLRYLKII